MDTSQMNNIGWLNINRTKQDRKRISDLKRLCALDGIQMIFFVLLLFAGTLLISCAQSPAKTIKSPEYEYIHEYAYSPDRSRLALIVPLDHYSRQTGLEESKIIVLDAENWEVLYAKEFSEVGPYNLKFVDSNTQLLFMMNGLRGKMSIVNWDFTTGLQLEYTFTHAGFSISNSKESVVAWGNFQQRGNGEFIRGIDDGQLYFYSLPDFEQYNAITVTPGDGLEIRHVEWSNDDQELLALGRLNRPPAFHSIYHVSISSGEQRIEISDVPTWDSFAWNPTDELIAFTNVFGVDIFHARYDCYVANIEFPHTPYEPIWNSYFLTIIQDKGPIQGQNQLIELNLDYLAGVNNSECLE